MMDLLLLLISRTKWTARKLYGKMMVPNLAQSVTQALPLLTAFSAQRFWVDYDREADVLYISFQRPQKATNTQTTDDGLLLRYRGEALVGITVLDASTRHDTPIPIAEN